MRLLSKLLDLRGLKVWFLVLAIVLNAGFSVLFFAGVNYWLSQDTAITDSLDLVLMLGEFLVCGLVAFGIAYLAPDLRGPSYAVWGGIASFVVVVIFMYRSGLLALLVGLTALLGAYNGGMLAVRIKMNRAG